MWFGGACSVGACAVWGAHVVWAPALGEAALLAASERQACVFQRGFEEGGFRGKSSLNNNIEHCVLMG